MVSFPGCDPRNFVRNLLGVQKFLALALALALARWEPVQSVPVSSTSPGVGPCGRAGGSGSNGLLRCDGPGPATIGFRSPVPPPYWGSTAEPEDGRHLHRSPPRRPDVDGGSAPLRGALSDRPPPRAHDRRAAFPPWPKAACPAWTA
jgi:hypothetical protein